MSIFFGGEYCDGIGKLELCKIEALFREFPFLGHGFKPTEVCWVKIVRPTLRLLDCAPYGMSFWPSEYGTSRGAEETRCFLFDKVGRFLTEVNRPVYTHNPERVWWRPSTWNLVEVQPTETVGQCLERLGKTSDQVVFFLWARILYQGRRHDGAQIVIFKRPARFESLNDYWKYLQSELDSQVKSEISEVEK